MLRVVLARRLIGQRSKGQRDGRLGAEFSFEHGALQLIRHDITTCARISSGNGSIRRIG